MSYDLMVFDPDTAPRDSNQFASWYEAQTGWTEDHSYDDPANTTAALVAWYRDMLAEYPAMNGPDAIEYPVDSEEWDNPKMTGYTIGNSVIYCDFRWSVAEEAYASVRHLADKHKIGFYDVSGSGDIIFP